MGVGCWVFFGKFIGGFSFVGRQLYIIHLANKFEMSEEIEVQGDFMGKTFKHTTRC
jgi:hypothetical protein